MRITLFLFLCVLAVGGGFGWGVWEYQKNTQTPVRQIIDGMKGAAGNLSSKPTTDPGTGNPPADPGGSQTTVKPTDKPDPKDPGTGTSKPPDPTPVSATDPAMAAVVEEARRAYAGGDFATAKRLFLRALSGKLAPEEARRVQALKANASLFLGLVEQVNPADILPVDRRAIVHLRNGGVITGVVEKEGGGGIDLRKDNGILAHFSTVQVDRIERPTKEEVLAELAKEYDRKVEGMGPKPTGLDFYELAVFCIKNQLNDRVTPLLEKAVALDRNVLEAATETKAKLLYDMFVYLDKKGKREAAEAKKAELVSKYPSSRYAKLAQQRTMVAAKDPVKPPPVDPAKDPPVKDPPVKDPPVKDPPVKDPPPDDGNRPKDPSDPGGDHPPVEVPGEPVFSNPKVADLVKKGNAAYDEGMKHLDKYFDDATKDPDAENLKALDAFKKACAAYEAAVEIDSNNAWLNDRLRQAGENRVMCFIAAKSRR